MIIDRTAANTAQTSFLVWNHTLTAKLARNAIKPLRHSIRAITRTDSLSSAEIRIDDPVAASKEVIFDYDCDDEGSNNTSSTTGLPEKRVRFHVDDRDDIVAQVILLTKTYDEDPSELFWSAQERNQFKLNMRLDAYAATKELSTQIAQLQDLYANAVSREVSSDEIKEGLSAIMEWSDSTHDCRGLERLVLNGAAEYTTRRCVRNVLRAQLVLQQKRTQQRCANVHNAVCFSEAATRKLRQRSRKWSRHAEEFAFLLALGDNSE
jgi:hypothetical protein